MSHASYLSKIFISKQQNITVKQIRNLIKEKNLNFDGFIVTGVSGIVMGSILARSLKKDLVVVRKNDGSHSSHHVENFKHGRNYIFLDDLIASGNTYKCVKTSLDICTSKEWLYGKKSPMDSKSKIIGTILYFNTFDGGVEFWSNQKIGKYIKNR